jgi:hypothetical protein
MAFGAWVPPHDFTTMGLHTTLAILPIVRDNNFISFYSRRKNGQKSTYDRKAAFYTASSLLSSDI